MEFTAEQQAHIDSLIAQKTTGLLTEDEVTRRVTSEVDRRVESGIQKGLETQREKWEREFTDKAKLTAEELAQKELAEQMAKLDGDKKVIAKRANTLDARELLAGASIPKPHYEKFIDLLVSDDEDVTKTNVQNFIDTFIETKTSIEADIKSKYTDVPLPNKGGGDKPVTQEDFDKMGYMEKIKFRESNPDQYKKFMTN